MSKPVNLNRYRKEKARAEKKARADNNAVTFGRTKAEKEKQKTENILAWKKLDGHEIEE
ncbi:DUF4169 family protein [Lutimaribacter marinistellae]|uniref:DUF4169 family protein n=1 Tax=Lutimaribacter marinistellae TaxID=1820329 RepID=A0ABV7TMC7_9RHOB